MWEITTCECHFQGWTILISLFMVDPVNEIPGKTTSQIHSLPILKLYYRILSTGSVVV